MSIERGSIQFIIDYKNLEVQQDENIPPPDPTIYPIQFRPSSNRFLIYNDLVKSYVYPVVGSIGIEGNYYPTSEIFSYLLYVENEYSNLFSNDVKKLGILKELALSKNLKSLPEKQKYKFYTTVEITNLSSSNSYLYFYSSDNIKIDEIDIDPKSFISFDLEDFASDQEIFFKGNLKIKFKTKIFIFYYIQEVEGTPTPDKNAFDVASILISSKPPIFLDKLQFDSQTKTLKYFDNENRSQLPVKYNYNKVSYDIFLQGQSTEEIYVPFYPDNGYNISVKEILNTEVTETTISINSINFEDNSNMIDFNSKSLKILFEV